MKNIFLVGDGFKLGEVNEKNKEYYVAIQAGSSTLYLLLVYCLERTRGEWQPLDCLSQ